MQNVFFSSKLLILFKQMVQMKLKARVSSRYSTGPNLTGLWLDMEIFIGWVRESRFASSESRSVPPATTWAQIASTLLRRWEFAHNSARFLAETNKQKHLASNLVPILSPLTFTHFSWVMSPHASLIHYFSNLAPLTFVLIIQSYLQHRCVVVIVYQLVSNSPRRCLFSRPKPNRFDKSTFPFWLCLLPLYKSKLDCSNLLPWTCSNPSLIV